MIKKKKTRNSEVLTSFTEYCKKNPEERFWQALRNWSNFSFVFVSDSVGIVEQDTFYWEGKRGFKKES